MPRRATAFALIALAGSAALWVWLVFGGLRAWTPFGGLVAVMAILLLAAAVGLANSGRGEGDAVAEPVAGPAVEPVTGDVGGVHVVLSERGISVPFGRGWRDFSGYPAFAADAAFPPGAAELETADPPGGSFGVVGTHGVVLLPDGSLIADVAGETLLFDDLASLFSGGFPDELRPTRASAFVLELFGHAYVAEPDGTLVPAADGSDAPRGTIADILDDPAAAPAVARYRSRSRPDRVFAAIGGRTVRLGADGTVEWIRADRVVAFPDLASAMAAIRAADARG